MHIVNGKVPLLIEVKDMNNNSKFEEELVKLLDEYDGEFAIQSMNPYITKLVRTILRPSGASLAVPIKSLVITLPKLSNQTNVLASPEGVKSYFKKDKITVLLLRYT